MHKLREFIDHISNVWLGHRQIQKAACGTQNDQKGQCSTKETRLVWSVVGWRLVGHLSSQIGQGGPLYTSVGKGLDRAGEEEHQRQESKSRHSSP